MKNVGRDVVAFKRRAQKSYAEMKKARGQVARYCLEDANFYMARAIEIAGAAGRNGMVAPDDAGIARWENEGGAFRT